eukprot:m.139757 g.139757  ORF g.139757 m.139757 type:complete len:56 (-) comp30076_c0_seq1:118-285(-)
METLNKPPSDRERFKRGGKQTKRLTMGNQNMENTKKGNKDGVERTIEARTDVVVV